MSGHKGLYAKYEVIRKETGEKCDGCFVLRPVTDTAAWQAVMFYSYLTHNPRLGKEIRVWLKKAKVRAKQVKRHTFRLGRYKIEFTGKLYGNTDTPDEIIKGKPINYCWEDTDKEICIVEMPERPLEELDNILHEALHAQGIPNEYLHDKEGNSDTISIARFLWRLGYRKVK